MESLESEKQCTVQSQRQSDAEFERELITGADEILRRTDEAAEREATIQLHETKDEYEDGPWGPSPMQIVVLIFAMSFIALALFNFWS